MEKYQIVPLICQCYWRGRSLEVAHRVISSSQKSSKLRVACKAASRMDVIVEDVREDETIVGVMVALAVSSVLVCVERGQVLDLIRSSSNDT